ncbi:ubiquitin-conjugating enzyme/RWD-like protein [Syncephalastrum racemosum]|uniref:Ubiquitin-conjugating enzyme E2 6 n=1 Tax=Syncephalastrum racemosum TaxID=13706 RepID=A0A1X2H8J9_SYNRA|nr:ubiquitin-conjugating enzyme/RWD-like protein [Syncephalastrum racemosum]
MATKSAFKRLTKEYLEIQKNPPPFIIARPVESNILEWHYVIRGPPETPYEGGEYYGRLTFPSDYPFKPPAIRMTTPSGRFQPDTRLCLTMSDFHPSLWNPSWSVPTILNGLLSFMTTDETTTGSIKTTDAEKRIFAARSHRLNLKNQKFREVFPELCTVELAPMANAPMDMRRRTTTASKPAAHQQSQHFQHRHAQQQYAQDNPSALTRTVTQWRRWLVILVVFIYLIISKLAQRSTTASASGSDSA